MNLRDKIKSEIMFLLDDLEKIIESPENQSKKHLFKDIGEWGRDMWRGVPRDPCSSGMPFTVAPDNSFWSALFNTSLLDFYSDPLEHLRLQLKLKKFTFEHFRDDTYMTKEIFIWFSIISSLSFFGPAVSFFKDREPVLEGKAILENPDALDDMEPPDFSSSGLMPRILMYYEELNELVNGRFKVMFPQWARGPYAIAIHLRGFENFLMDTVDEPEYVHRLMRFVTDARKKWFTDRAAYLNEPVPFGKLYNDEVDSPTISPGIYDEFIFPYEKELSEFHGGISYYHSCGNTTSFMKSISRLPKLEYFHVSPWADLKTAVETFEDSTALDIVLNPLEDCYMATEKQMADKIKSVMALCPPDKRCTLRIDGFQPFETIERDTKRIEAWSDLARPLLKTGR